MSSPLVDGQVGLFDAPVIAPHHGRRSSRSELAAARKAGPTTKTQQRKALEVIGRYGPQGASNRDIQRALWDPADPAWNKVATRTKALEGAGLVECRYDDRGDRIVRDHPDGGSFAGTVSGWATDSYMVAQWAGLPVLDTVPGEWSGVLNARDLAAAAAAFTVRAGESPAVVRVEPKPGGALELTLEVPAPEQPSLYSETPEADEDGASYMIRPVGHPEDTYPNVSRLLNDDAKGVGVFTSDPKRLAAVAKTCPGVELLTYRPQWKRVKVTSVEWPQWSAIVTGMTDEMADE